MQDILSLFSYWLLQIFNPSTSGMYLSRIYNAIVSEPLFMAVISMFFAGFIVSILLRIYHTA